MIRFSQGNQFNPSTYPAYRKPISRGGEQPPLFTLIIDSNPDWREVASAGAIEFYLMCGLGVPGENISMLRGKDATSVNITDHLIRLRNNTQDGDAILIYYAGPYPAHSSRNTSIEIIMPWDPAGDTTQSTPLPLSPLLNKLAWKIGNNIVR
jgi:hypothetical protein